MRLISASALWWLALGAPIVLLYLLKLKRTRHVVSSILLWQRAIQEMQANVPFKKLRRNLLLILQLAILALIVLALSRPAITSHALARGSTIIVVDATASMGARDEDGGRKSRLERARQIVREMLGGIGGETRAALIEAAARPRLVCPITSDRSRLASSLLSIKQTDEAGDLHEAVMLGCELAKAQQESEVVVISDGGGAAGPIDSRSVRVRYLKVGQRSDNVGIVAMNTRTLPGGAQELFASVANFSEADRTFQAELRINGKLVDVRAIRLGPATSERPAGRSEGAGAREDAASGDGTRVSNRRSLIFDSLPRDGGVAELKLDIDDDLQADNVAFATIKSSRRPLVGAATSNRFIWLALGSDPDVETHRVELDQTSDFGRYDVLILEGDRAAKATGGNQGTLWINPPDVAGYWAADTGNSPSGAAGSISADQSHPVNSYITYEGVNFDQRRVFRTAAWLKPIVSDNAGGLIWAGENNGKRTVLLGFDLAKTDLPIRMEFPILMANCIAWLTQATGGEGRAEPGNAQDQAVRTGQQFRIQSGAPRISIERPDGSLVQCDVRDGAATFDATDQAGTYISKEANAQLRASLLSGGESDTRPRDRLGSGGAQIENSVETYRTDNEVWPWVLIGALIVMAIEWLVYLRRALGA